MATLCPIYGYLGLQAEQARIAFFICKATLPSMKPEEAMKNSPDFVFDSRNLAAIEALSRLTKGNGEGVENVWKLVEATMEVIEEYIPEKDQSNNYVRSSPASPRVCAEYEIIEEQTDVLLGQVAQKAVETEMGCDLVIHTLEMMLQAARSGVSSEVPSGKANLMKAWDEVLRSAGLEEKVKIPHSSPIQTASGLKHLLAIANTNISRLERLVQTTESLTPLSSIQSLLTEAVSQLKRHPSLPGLVQPIFFFISEVMEQVNDNHPAKETYQAAIPELLKIVNTLVTNRQTQVLALDTLYDVIIQGDCLRGQWKPIISCLKKIATSDLCAEGFHDVQLILDDFLSEMDFSEALTLGALIASYTRQAFDINIALSAIGLYWKLADYTLITARGTRSLRI
ncbi:uncharacterized protein [Blastocystis hominis]|uniref:Uncharacterized protein n=1 Tax=Blastocystis hominis TaxID=12968 RepID=D8MBV4_BLAHO|nr:uncharacterized protein [Blastocystis hominis]CBK25543.2 unnamed protein product [Blastocystis hominis]|eukprot:XP_012899591.1 uncharacterized protein [Blastocystis hominis]